MRRILMTSGLLAMSLLFPLTSTAQMQSGFGNSMGGMGSGMGNMGGGMSGSGMGGFGSGGMGSGFGSSGMGGMGGMGSSGMGGFGNSQGGMSQMGGMGQMGAQGQAGRFLGGNNQQNFVGRNAQTTGQGMNGQNNTFGQGMNRAGARGSMNTFNNNLGGSQNSNTHAAPLVRPRQKIAFDYPVPQTGYLQTKLTNHVARVSNRHPGLKDVTVDMNPGGEAVLSGSVATQADAKLAENLLRLEPGIRTVQNQLTFPDQSDK